MLCMWCGEETPDGSAFCEKCGHELKGVEVVPDSEDVETALDPESVVSEDESVEQPDIEPLAIEEESPDDISLAIAEDQSAPALEEELSDDASIVPEEDFSDGIASEIPGSYSEAFPSDEAEASVEPTRRISVGGPYVEPPSPPIQPELSRGRIAIVATIAVLFAAAVILLAWASILRFLGL